jgi:inner membrane protein
VATPIGHGLAGCGVALLAGRDKGALVLPTLVAAAASVAPDLDFIPGLLRGTPALYHHGISHSLGFALAAGVLGALVLPLPGWSRRSVFWLVSMAYASHLLLDLVGPDARPPIGIPLFWPLSSVHLLSPTALLMGVRHAPATGVSVGVWLQTIFSWYNLLAIALEIVVVAPFVALAAWSARRARSRSTGR